MRYRHSTASLAAGFCLAALSACTPSLAVGIREFDRGRYPEALSELELLRRSRPLAELGARYSLYRGLTELALGNAPEAYVWLSATKVAVATRPEVLDRAERGRLRAAWHTLGKMPAQLR